VTYLIATSTVLKAGIRSKQSNLFRTHILGHCRPMRPAIILAIGISVANFQGQIAGAEVSPTEAPTIELSKPLEIAFGRGSGWHGLDTIRILTNGVVTLYKQTLIKNQRSWQTASLQLSTSDQKKISEALLTNRILNLKDQIATNVADGTQWILLVRQNSASKAVYFDNKFPTSISNFAQTVDLVLEKQPIQWKPAPREPREHEKELWAAIRRSEK
jgi:hypothetical protein